MRKFSVHTACVAVALGTIAPATALAQTNSTDANVDITMNADDPALNSMSPAPDPYANDLGTTTAAPLEDDHDHTPWGLLGLLGLAGLLGRKRRDEDHVHIDRTDTPNNRM